MYQRNGCSLLVTSVLCTLIPVCLAARDRDDKAPRLPFGTSERLVYESEFSKLMLRGIDIAEVRLTAEHVPPHEEEGGKVRSSTTRLRLTSEVSAKGWLIKLLGLNFNYRIESLVEPSSFLVLRTTTLDEQGKRLRRSETIFDHAAGKVIWTEHDLSAPARRPRVIASPLDGAVYDVVSAIYFLRTQALTPGKSFELPVSDSGKVYRIRVRVVEMEPVKNVFGNVSAARVEADVFGKERLLDGEGRMSIWFTDDAHRIPVQARFSSEMGTLNLKLKSVTRD